MQISDLNDYTHVVYLPYEILQVFLCLYMMLIFPILIGLQELAIQSSRYLMKSFFNHYKTHACTCIIVANHAHS